MTPSVRSPARLERAILGLALAGMVLSVHLWIQKARDFDQGCWGVFKPTALDPADGCAGVALLPASHLLGISNAAWGYAFYFGVALASFARLAVGPRVGLVLHRARALATGAAFFYSAYLIGQMAFVARAWCVLCLLSAALVTALTLLQGMLHRRGGFAAIDDAERPRELAWAALAGMGAIGVLTAVLLFVNRLGTRPLGDGSTGHDLEAAIGRTLPQFIEAEKLAEMRPCRFDAGAPALEVRRLLDDATPFLGAADGVEVTVFLDANCPHCRAYYPTVRRLIDRHAARAQFALVPVVLWDESVGAAAAVRLAGRAGKALAVWDALFARELPPKGELREEELRRLLREAGVDAPDVAARLAAERGAAETMRTRLRAAGVRHAPALYVGGRRVWGPSRGEECVGRLIEQAASRR
jgi:uncharacterized membrane protein/protein-disulfide isomerase